MKDATEKSFRLSDLTVLERPGFGTAEKCCRTPQSIVPDRNHYQALYGREGKPCKGGATASLPPYILFLLMQ